MDEDWDLFAVVRGCTSATNTATTTTKDTTQNTYPITEDSKPEDTLACLASLTFEDDDPFSFPNLVHPSNNGFGELQDSYKPFLPTPTTTSTTINSQGMIPSSSDSDFGRLNVTQQQQQLLLQAANVSITLPFNPTPPIFAFGESNNQQQPQLVQQQQQPQQQQQQQQQNQQRQLQQQAGTSSVLPLRTMQSQAPRSRKRKNQQKRMVCHVTADNLSSDLWAWRKYGQKPIKGSPYPRNYYRCSSSKGCSARKQVERSNTDPNIFIVTYTGDHTHPRPTHRNSLAGSTRNKIQNPTSSKESEQPSIAIASCSSPLSTTSLSPTTPLPAPIEEETMNDNIEHRTLDGADKESEEMEDDDDDDDDDVDLLIPNLAMNEDFFLGLQELGSSSAGASTTSGFGQSPAFGDNFTSWGPGSSAAAGATTNGGC